MAEFDDEVDEVLRRERLKAAWDRYGNYGIGAVVAVLLTVASWSVYDHIVSTERNKLGDVLFRGEGAERSEQVDNALIAYGYLRENASDSAYGLIAAFREAALLGQSKRLDEQRAVYEAILALPDLPPFWYETTRFYMAWSYLEQVEPAELKIKFDPFLNEDNHYYAAALEAMIFSHAIADEPDSALEYAERLSEYTDNVGLFNYADLIKGGKPILLDRDTIEAMERKRLDAEKARIQAREAVLEKRRQAKRISDERLFRDVDAESLGNYFSDRDKGVFSDNKP